MTEAAAAYLHEQSKEQLRTVVERVERLEEEKASLAADISEVYKEAKGNGFDPKIIRKIVSMRKKEEHKRLEDEMVLATYLHALGMLGQIADLPLGQAAIGHNSRNGVEAPQTGEAAVSTLHASDMDRARQKGQDAADDGMKRMENPYLSDDPRYAAWDEGFSGSARQVAA